MYLYFTPASVEGHKNNLCTFVQLYFLALFIFIGRRKRKKFRVLILSENQQDKSTRKYLVYICLDVHVDVSQGYDQNLAG